MLAVSEEILTNLQNSISETNDWIQMRLCHLPKYAFAGQL